MYNRHIKNKPTIDIIIPCVPQHIEYLPNVINSINNNTIHPDNIIIALSESEYSNYLVNYLQRQSKSIPIILNTTSSKAYAAENRNRGAKFSNADILMFMDADDLMFNNCIEVVMKVMNLHNTDAVLHGYTHNINYIEPKKQKIYTNVIDPINFAKLEKSDRSIWHTALKKIDPQHGHITIRRHAYIELGGQNESEEWRRGQDAKFVRDLFKNNYRITYTPRKLTVYNQHLSSEPTFMEKYKYVIISLISVIILSIYLKRK